MSAIWNKSINNYFTIAARKRISGINDWKIFKIDLSDNSTTDITAEVTINEIELPLQNPVTSVIIEIIDDLNFVVQDILGFYVGMKLFIVDQYVVIEKIANSQITLCDIPKHTLTVDDVVIESSKTGDYKVFVPANTLTGNNYQFFAQSKECRVSITSQIISCESSSISSEDSTIVILGDFYELKLGSFIKVYVKCKLGIPTLEIKNSNAIIMETFTSSTYNSTPDLYVFDVFIDDLGEMSTGGINWQDGYYVMKVQSDLLPPAIKPIQLVRPEDYRSSLSDISNSADIMSEELASGNKAYIKM